MLDKNLIQNNFKKSLKTYNRHAQIQKEMAQTLVSLIKKQHFQNVLEIGSYTGILTEELIRKISFDEYLALDIVESFDFIKNLSPKIKFQKSDIENFSTKQKFDLITANASLQWCLDFENTIKKLKTFLNKNGILAISIFGEKNLFEIKETFNVGLDYLSIDEIKKIFSNNAKIIEKTTSFEFQNPMEILKHLKYTGVNSISKNKLTISQIKEKMSILDKKYANKLTYNPLYIID